MYIRINRETCIVKGFKEKGGSTGLYKYYTGYIYIYMIKREWILKFCMKNGYFTMKIGVPDKLTWSPYLLTFAIDELTKERKNEES